ncbi:MAG: DUF1330 domain-containing protein [Xanthobacteraceae bacterium]
MTKKGYWIAHVDVSDPEAYKAYVAANAVPFKKYGARFIIRAGAAQTVEGVSRARHVVLEFPSYESALACYHSPEYKHAKTLREGKAQADITVLEGYDGPQPGDG